MSIEKNDPRLTAYALGEMEANEQSAFETQLDDAARVEIEAIRNVAGRIEDEWTEAEPPVMTPGQRARITGEGTLKWLVPAAAAVAIVALFLLWKGHDDSAFWKREAGHYRQTSQHWERMTEGLARELGRVRTAMTQLSAKEDTMSTQTSIRETRESALVARIDRAEATHEKNIAVIEELRNQIENLAETNRTYATWLAKYTEKAGSLQQDKWSTQPRHEEVNKRVRLESEVAKARDENARLSAKVGDLQKKLNNNMFWMAKYREKYGDIVGASAGQPGIVKAVRGNLISISVGSDVGVKIGDVYQLRRGGTYVGQITITSVQKDLAIGKFDGEFKGPGAPPQAGDKADPGGY